MADLIKGSDGTTTNQSKGTNIDINVVLIKRLTGQTLTRDEEQVFLANVSKLAEIAESASKLAEETDKKAKFDEFFGKLKTMSFESFEDFFAHVDTHRPARARKSGGAGKDQKAPLLSIDNLPEDSYNGAIVTVLRAAKQPLTVEQIVDGVTAKLPNKPGQYIAPRVRFGLKHNLAPFVTITAGGLYQLTPAAK